jgi:MazG family protein
MEEFQKLYGIIQTLRGENGCPWDKEQTVRSIKQDIIEEAHELVEAIEKNDNADLEEEVGDLFFLALFTAYIAEEEKRMTVKGAINGVAEKLIRRHPHVFGGSDEKNVDQILVNWEAIKNAEKKNQSRTTPFDGIPKSLPEIQRFFKILEKIKRAKGKIEKVQKEKLKSSFEAFLEQKESMESYSFIKDLFYYSFNAGIDLSSFVRKISLEAIEKHLAKNV